MSLSPWCELEVPAFSHMGALESFLQCLARADGTSERLRSAESFIKLFELPPVLLCCFSLDCVNYVSPLLLLVVPDLFEESPDVLIVFTIEELPSYVDALKHVVIVTNQARWTHLEASKLISRM